MIARLLARTVTLVVGQQRGALVAGVLDAVVDVGADVVVVVVDMTMVLDSRVLAEARPRGGGGRGDAVEDVRHLQLSLLILLAP